MGLSQKFRKQFSGFGKTDALARVDIHQVIDGNDERKRNKLFYYE